MEALTEDRMWNLFFRVREDRERRAVFHTANAAAWQDFRKNGYRASCGHPHGEQVYGEFRLDGHSYGFWPTGEIRCTRADCHRQTIAGKKKKAA